MPRGIDHIVHAVRDLDAAAALYRGLGFTVGGRNRHPWGTHNHIVQLPGFFIELLTLAEPDKLGSDGFSQLFGAYNRDFLKSHEGLSLLILESRDADADEKDFRAAAIAASDVMRFEREGRRPDGSSVKLGFSLAFADDTRAPQIHFATCQQHYPENFWNPAFQKHANSASGIAGVVAVADKPEQHRAFMQAFAGAQAVQWRERIHHRHAARHDRDDDTRRLHPPLRRGGAGRYTRRAACRASVSPSPMPALLQTVPELAGIVGLYAGNPAVIGADDAMGAVIVFEPYWPVDPTPRPLHGRTREDQILDQSLLPNAAVTVGAVRFGNDLPLALIAGPCALESRAHALEMASALKEIAGQSGHRSRLQNQFRQSQPHVVAQRARAWGSTRRCRSLPRSATS